MRMQKSAVKKPAAAPPDAEEKRSQAAKLLAQLRWANTTPKERSAFASKIAKARTREQARSDKPRCPCGAMTQSRADARCHKCVAGPEPVLPPRPPRFRESDDPFTAKETK